jgi:predicted acetyltransferase
MQNESSVLFEYVDPGTLQDDDLILTLDRFERSDPLREWLPTYHFKMVHRDADVTMGSINLRVGSPQRIVLYRGHIGYGVQSEYRGKHYSSRSVKLLLGLAARCRIDPVWITCNPDNIASRRSCEIAGGELIEIIDVAADEEMYARGIRHKCRYRFDIL